MQELPEMFHVRFEASYLAVELMYSAAPSSAANYIGKVRLITYLLALILWDNACPLSSIALDHVYHKGRCRLETSQHAC